MRTKTGFLLMLAVFFFLPCVSCFFGSVPAWLKLVRRGLLSVCSLLGVDRERLPVILFPVFCIFSQHQKINKNNRQGVLLLCFAFALLTALYNIIIQQYFSFCWYFVVCCGISRYHKQQKYLSNVVYIHAENSFSAFYRSYCIRLFGAFVISGI